MLNKNVKLHQNFSCILHWKKNHCGLAIWKYLHFKLKLMQTWTIKSTMSKFKNCACIDCEPFWLDKQIKLFTHFASARLQNDTKIQLLPWAFVALKMSKFLKAMIETFAKAAIFAFILHFYWILGHHFWFLEENVNCLIFAWIAWKINENFEILIYWYFV